MECQYHPGVEPVARCSACGKYLCASCAHDRANRMYCVDCLPVNPPDQVHVLVSVEDLQVSRAFTYVFDDPRWPVKVIIGALFMLASVLVVPFFFILGYQLEIVRRVAAGDDCTMPEWDGMGRKFTEGAAMFLIGLVYAIPVLIVIGAVTVLGLLVGGNPDAVRHAITTGIALFGFIIGWLLVVIYGLLLRLASPAITGTYAKTRSISKSLQVGVVVGLIKADLKAYLLVLLLTVFVTSAIAFLGIFACCIGVLLTTFYAALVNAHLIGQLARLNPMCGSEDEA